jgi:hypothetical protein
VDLGRVLRAVGSELLLAAARDGSCPCAAAALKLLSVPLWACVNDAAAATEPSALHVAHHAAVAVLLCTAAADAALRGDSTLLQLLVSCCVASTHAVLSAAHLPALKCAEVDNHSKSVVDAWRGHLLRTPKLLQLCPSVLCPQHSHSEQVWSLMLHHMLASPAPIDNTTLSNIISISAVFKEQTLTCRVIANLPGSLLHLISRDVVSLFLRRICPESLCDLSANAAAFSSWLQSLSPEQLSANEEMTRLMCNVVAPTLRGAAFAQALPILNLCAFETPMPALFMAQNSVFNFIQLRAASFP